MMNPSDLSALGALRELFQLCDPAPPGVVEAAYGALGYARPCGTEPTLELVADSADMPAPARMRAGRAAPESRTLTFMMPGRIIELDLRTSTPGMARATGVVVNRSRRTIPEGALVLSHPDGQCAAELDSHGAFRLLDVPRGPLRVAFHPPRSTPMFADWLVC